MVEPLAGLFGAAAVVVSLLMIVIVCVCVCVHMQFTNRSFFSFMHLVQVCTWLADFPLGGSCPSYMYTMYDRFDITDSLSTNFLPVHCPTIAQLLCSHCRLRSLCCRMLCRLLLGPWSMWSSMTSYQRHTHGEHATTALS